MPVDLVEPPDRRADIRAERRQILADEHELGGDDAAHARQEIGRRAIVDRDGDHAAEQASPERDDPLRAVLAPEHHLVALAEAGVVQPRSKTGRSVAHFLVRVRATAEPIVVHEELAARGGEVVEEVDERVAGHG